MSNFVVYCVAFINTLLQVKEQCLCRRQEMRRVAHRWRGRSTVYPLTTEVRKLFVMLHYTLIQLPLFMFPLGNFFNFAKPFIWQAFSDVAIVSRRLVTHIFPPLSIARFSFIQLSELGHRGENENSEASKQRQQRGFEPMIPQFRVWHSTAELPPSIYSVLCKWR